jgi:hypothetical protein
MATIAWWLLAPDIGHALLTGGLGPEDARAVAARACDRSFAIVYLPTSREITIQLGELAGPQVVARWYDPADGRLRTVSGSPFPATGSRRLKPERASNSSGFDDWALILPPSGDRPLAASDRSLLAARMARKGAANRSPAAHLVGVMSRPGWRNAGGKPPRWQSTPPVSALTLLRLKVTPGDGEPRRSTGRAQIGSPSPERRGHSPSAFVRRKVTYPDCRGDFPDRVSGETVP